MTFALVILDPIYLESCIYLFLIAFKQCPAVKKCRWLIKVAPHWCCHCPFSYKPRLAIQGHSPTGLFSASCKAPAMNSCLLGFWPQSSSARINIDWYQFKINYWKYFTVDIDNMNIHICKFTNRGYAIIKFYDFKITKLRMNYCKIYICKI